MLQNLEFKKKQEQTAQQVNQEQQTQLRLVIFLRISKIVQIITATKECLFSLREQV